MTQRAVIITALDIEYKAVRAHLTDLREVVHEADSVYELGIFSSYGRSWEIGIVQVRKGDMRAAVQTERAISYFKPNVAFFVGVAGGIKDVHLGDVVVADKIYGYESGNDAVEFMPRPEMGITSFRMIERAQAEARKGDWLQRIVKSVQELQPRVLIGPIAAGEKVVASTQSATFQLIKSQYSDSLAVEMEGIGFFGAVHANRDLDALVIRGISDLIDDKKNADKAGWQEKAAGHASAFAFEILAKLPDQKEDVDNSFVSWNVPARNPYFTGREGILSNLHKELLTSGTAAISQPIAISGLGGIGKTQTAIEYVYRYRNSYTAIFWVMADSDETLTSAFFGIASLLGLVEKEEKDQYSVLNALKRWLEQNNNWLLIFDNADDPSLLKTFLPRNTQGHIILTSRAQVFDAIGIKNSFEVEKLTPSEAKDFLINRTSHNKLRKEEIEAIEVLAKDLDYLPLALEQAAAYVFKMKTSFETYLLSYRTRGLSLLEKSKTIAGGYPNSVATTWLLNFEQVEKASPASADLLRFSAFLSPDRIPFELVISGSQTLGPLLSKALASGNIDPLILDEILEPLTQFSLISKDPESRTYDIHRLVQTVLKSIMDVDIQRIWAERAVRAVIQAFHKLGSIEYSTWPQCERLLLHAEICAEHCKKWGLDSKEVAWLLYLTGCYLRDLELYWQALMYFKRAQEIFEKQTDTGNRKDLAAVLNNMGGIYHAMAKFKDAEETFMKAIEIYQKEYGLDHPMLAQGLHNLAALYYDEDKHEDAITFYLRAIDIFENNYGPNHLDVAISLKNLGILYNSQHRYDEAERILKRALDIQEKILKSDHPIVALTLSSLALVYQDQKRYSAAEPLYQKALEIFQNAYGLNRAIVAQLLNNYAELYHVQGKYADAETMFKKALVIWEKAFHPEHPKITQTLHNLAALYMHQGKYDDSETLFKRALKILENMPGQGHQRIATTLDGLAFLYTKTGNQYGAKQCRERSKMIRMITNKQSSPDRAKIKKKRKKQKEKKSKR